jgi:hypothetical protein
MDARDSERQKRTTRRKYLHEKVGVCKDRGAVDEEGLELLIGSQHLAYP